MLEPADHESRIQALEAEIEALKELARKNSARIVADRRNRKMTEMAIYILLGIAAVLAVGYKRQEGGTWSWEIPAEVAIVALGGGGLLYKILEDPDRDE